MSLSSCLLRDKSAGGEYLYESDIYNHLRRIAIIIGFRIGGWNGQEYVKTFEIINTAKDKEAAIKVALALLVSLQEGPEKLPAPPLGVS